MGKDTFEIRDEFYVNGEKMKIISGGIHYFRIIPEYWRDRLEKLKAMGCNTVETYVPWNMHEPKKGEFNFEGMYDLEKFLQLAGELGLYAIVRPSPYICAEWEFGGLPAWLLAEDGMRLRGNYEPYLQHIKEYYKRLFTILTPLQITNGGPIIMFQIENEYGYYGDDSNYMNALKDMMTDNGVIVPFVTSDGPFGDAMACGVVEGVLTTGNFGSRALERFETVKKYTNGGPLMCMEFWVGWFDAWGTPKHQTSNLEENIKDLNDILEVGNVNIYMFIGGTNFGFTSGANYYDKLTPDVTSYDYDAVLTEDGRITKKYEEFKKVISKFTNIPEVTFSTEIKRTAYGELKVAEKVGLFEALQDISEGTTSTYTMPMEKLGQNYGYILYTSNIVKSPRVEKIRLLDANDRANIFISEKPVLTLYDRELLEEKEVSWDTGNESIEILVENMGRVNFGPKIEKQRKGIETGVQLNGHHHFNWTQYPLPLNNLDQLDFSRGYKEGRPAFYRFEFEVKECADTFLDITGWGKGCAFINQFNLGRFWEIGPQKRLYIPGPLLKVGKNEIIIFETEGKVTDSIQLMDQPDLG